MQRHCAAEYESHVLYVARARYVVGCRVWLSLRFRMPAKQVWHKFNFMLLFVIISSIYTRRELFARLVPQPSSRAIQQKPKKSESG